MLLCVIIVTCNIFVFMSAVYMSFVCLFFLVLEVHDCVQITCIFVMSSSFLLFTCSLCVLWDFVIFMEVLCACTIFYVFYACFVYLICMQCFTCLSVFHASVNVSEID